MKGIIALIFCFLALNVSAQAQVSKKARYLTAIKLTSGEMITHLSLQESSKVLKSLDLEVNIEIRERVIYPEEVSQLIMSKLTKVGIAEKKPNPQDYN
jgi:hypothetical protein